MTDSCVGCYRIAFLLIMLYCYINFCFPIMIYSTNYFQHVQKFRIIIMFSPVCEYMIPEPKVHRCFQSDIINVCVFSNNKQIKKVLSSTIIIKVFPFHVGSFLRCMICFTFPYFSTYSWICK